MPCATQTYLTRLVRRYPPSPHPLLKLISHVPTLPSIDQVYPLSASCLPPCYYIVTSQDPASLLCTSRSCIKSYTRRHLISTDRLESDINAYRGSLLFQYKSTSSGQSSGSSGVGFLHLNDVFSISYFPVILTFGNCFPNLRELDARGV